MGDYGQLLFILSEPRLRSILHKFAEERHCSENVEFWTDIQLYKQQPTLDEAQKLYDKYFKPDSDHQLSFDSDITKEIDRKIAEGTVGKKLFEIAERTTVQLILFSILPYFKKAHPIIFEIKPPENHRLNYFSSYDLIEHRVYQRKYTRFQRLQFYKYDTSGPPGQVVPPRVLKQPDYFIPVQSQVKSQTPPTASNEEITKEEVSASSSPIALDSPSVTATYTKEEVGKHNTATDCWVIVNKKVYNVTEYVTKHIGGVDALVNRAGTDITKQFYGKQHPKRVDQIISKFYIGDLIK